MNLQELNEKIRRKSEGAHKLKTNIELAVVGQQDMVEKLIIAVIAGGHILLEGAPGLAKTLAASALAKSIGGSFKRIQFTPDLLPADITGSMVYNPKDNDFAIRRGPIFANFVLADEINRAPAKVQSALLEAMQERQVTIGNSNFPLNDPFVVVATQNPIEQEGTYQLPEAQQDRFLMKLKIDYPDKKDELLILRRNISDTTTELHSVLTIEDILEMRRALSDVYLDEKIENYIIDIVFASRQKGTDISEFISWGASPRATISIAKAARARAFVKGRGYVLPEDVRECTHDCMRHRIGLSYSAYAKVISTDNVISEILKSVKSP